MCATMFQFVHTCSCITDYNSVRSQKCKNTLLALSPSNKLPSVASIFKVLKCSSKLVKKSQTDWILLRRKVNRRLIWVQAVSICCYSYEWRAKGENIMMT